MIGTARADPHYKSMDDHVCLLADKWLPIETPEIYRRVFCYLAGGYRQHEVADYLGLSRDQVKRMKGQLRDLVDATIAHDYDKAGQIMEKMKVFKLFLAKCAQKTEKVTSSINRR